GLGSADWAAWRAMEAIHANGRARLLGVSNVAREQLELLCQRARVPPRFVQNRCYAARGWDRDIRQFCAAHGLAYQGFSLLTANRDALAHRTMARIARRHGRAVTQIVFRFALALAGATVPAAAQPPRQPNPANQVVSPEMHPDKKVTFRIYAPKSSEVTVRGDWMTGAPAKLTKDDKGVWSATVGPLRPDYY